MEFTPLYGTRFQSHYENTLSYDLVDKLGIVNSYETPKIEKIILSSSVSFKPQQVRGLAKGCLRLGGSSSSLASQSSNNKAKSKTTFGKGGKKGGMPALVPPKGGMQRASLENCSTQVRKALILLSGQSLRNITFRVGRPHLGIREGRLAAYQVTLRNENMYLFLERLLTEVIPKVIKTDPATLMTSTSDRRLQRTSTKLANFETGDLIPYSGQA
jgi:ribosomal protein L5